MRIASLIPLIAAAAFLAAPPPALAGTYTVDTCQTASGRWTGAEGWTSAASQPATGYDSGLATACTQQRPNLKLEFSGLLPVTPDHSVSWTFTAPVATHISSIAVYRSLQLGWPLESGRYARPYVYDVWHDEDVPGNQLEFELPPWGGDMTRANLPDPLTAGGVSWSSASVRLSCWDIVGSLDCGPYAAQVLISRAAVGLTDVDAPEGFATGGALMGVDPVRGVAGLSFHATDQGGGVYRVALVVDGREVSRQVVDADGGACADDEPGDGDAHEFASPQPCPLEVDGSVQLDTTALTDGQHAVQAKVEDAAGNETVVFDDTVQTHNAPVNSAAPALSGQTSVGGQLAAAPGQWDGAPTRYDERWLRCDADGGDCVPVGGATGAQYALTADDAYHRMRVDVTAENGSGAETARSAPSALVADAAGRTAPPPPDPGDGTGGGGTTSPAPAPSPAPAADGIQGIANPLAQLPGHVANGSDASARVHLTLAFQRAGGRTAQRVRARYGRLTLAGRLTDAAGLPIGGARVGAAWRVAGHGWVARPGVRTGADGRFAYALPAGPSRDVRVTYFPYSDSRGAQLSNVVHADVLAPVTIAADHRRVAGARVVGLSGRVGGGAVPRAGLLVTLQGFQRGWGWRTFRTVRTDRRGRWSTRYRFRLSAGRFGFRALVPRQSGFAYAGGRSRDVYVTVS